jgi:DNA-binding PadR family transcriptional regulator
MPYSANNPNHILVLALVECGLKTTYDLKLQAGMSVGQSGPVLQHLERSGLLTAEPGTRRSLRYSITVKGKSELRAALASGKDDSWWVGKFGFFESIPRAVLLAWLASELEDYPKWLGYAEEELQASAQRAAQEAADLRNQMERLRRNPSPRGRPLLVGTTYRWMKVQTDALLLEAQAELVDTLAPLLTDLPPAPPIPPKS